MADQFNSPDPNRNDDLSFAIESFLSDIAKVSELEAKFLVNTKPIDTKTGPLSDELLAQLKEIVEADLSSMVRAPQGPKLIKISTSEPRLDTEEVAFRSEAVDKTDSKPRSLLPVSVISTPEGKKATQLEIFDVGKAAYITKIEIESDEDGGISIARYGVAQLDAAAFALAVKHLQETFEPDTQNRPSCLRDLVRGISELVFSEYTRKHIQDQGTDDLDSALESEAKRLKSEFNIPEVLGGKVVGSSAAPGNCSAQVKFDVAFTTIMEGTPFERRMVFTAVSQIFLDEMGVALLRITDIEDFRTESPIE